MMIRKNVTGCVLALFALALEAAPTAIVNVNIVPMTSETVIAGRTVVIEGDRIVAIGAVDETPVPKNALVVDGTDRYLMPGLTEMHGHVPGGNSAGLERVLSLYVANGITTVRGMLGQPSHLELREKLAAGEVLGPRLVTSGPSFNGRSVTSPAQAREMVRAQHEAGYDFLKIHPGLTRAEFDAMAETANSLGIRFAGHVPEDVGVLRALELGIATIDHFDGYMEALLRPNEDRSGGLSGFFGVFIADLADESKIDAIARRTAAAGTWNVPTESLFEHVTDPALSPDAMLGWPEMHYMPENTVRQWHAAKTDLLNDLSYDAGTAARAIEIRRQLIRSLRDAGAGLLLGSDSPQIFNVPGFAIHRELAYLVRAGLTPYEALATGTVNVAQYFDVAHERGTVQEGMIADLVLLDDDPLADIGATRRIHGVAVNGRWLGRPELDDLLGKLHR